LGRPVFWLAWNTSSSAALLDGCFGGVPFGALAYAAFEQGTTLLSFERPPL